MDDKLAERAREWLDGQGPIGAESWLAAFASLIRREALEECLERVSVAMTAQGANSCCLMADEVCDIVRGSLIPEDKP